MDGSLTPFASLTKFKMQIHCRSPYQRWTTSASSFACERHHVFRTFFVRFIFIVIGINADARSHKPTMKKILIIRAVRSECGEPLTKGFASTWAWLWRIAPLALTGQLINGVCRRVRRWKVFVHFSCRRRRCRCQRCWSSFSPLPLSCTQHASFAITVIIANSFGTMKIIIMRVELMWHASTLHFFPCDRLKSINSSNTRHGVCFILYSGFAQGSH